MTDPAAMYENLREEMGTVLIGNEAIIEQLTVALLSNGHVLLEGVPGVAKTTMANLFARASGLDYNRIQMTPDVLPADVTGTHVYHDQTGEFSLQRGPIFANFVVADEINRATPKTQSALLEAMQERTATIEGQTLDLPEPFIVVATQNPIEMEGTFELPEAQRDRFLFKLVVDLPTREDESALLDRFDSAPELGPEAIDQVVTPTGILEARQVVSNVHVDERVKGYILDLVDATRNHGDIAHGTSPRASLALLDAAKARAAIHGRDYAIPDDAKTLVRPTFTHRLVLSTDAELSGVTAEDALEEIMATVQPPGSDAERERESAVSDGGRSRMGE
ncbi:AAA family ATPase [Halalkalicoccus jeotgali]|uniref:ATPase n=1 Tax=Halalkalicoccus jeotgali (strain DSM 18796 / CECT 7217 / JCM 14584 / KCTC 4019 / B3) TaxID=795797 RepID=D8J6K1_HALJB|nr:MoxR family ATPase [Halalkalicoccus jeotgali]ADJ13878.1 ATPase associated with various cellular activities AAA_3 [Halalkalicoccus jeotgali B3]ELY34075.1 ATPase [Halalkalicoccus jeotgali B3]